MNIKLMIDDKIVFDKDILDILDNKQDKVDLAGEFYKYNGVKEYTGIVADIQKWFYGTMVYASWCATSVSYFANKLGILDKIGGRNENVYAMLLACKASADAGKGTFYDKQHLPTIIKRNDILFFEWDDKPMGITSNKHVGVCFEDTTLDLVKTIGGNQSDSICVKNYKKSDIYAIYRM